MQALFCDAAVAEPSVMHQRLEFQIITAQQTQVHLRFT